MGKVMVWDDIIFQTNSLNKWFDLIGSKSRLRFINALPIHDLKDNFTELFVGVKMHREIRFFKHIDVWIKENKSKKNHWKSIVLINFFHSKDHFFVHTKFRHPIKNVHLNIMD